MPPSLPSPDDLARRGSTSHHVPPFRGLSQASTRLAISIVRGLSNLTSQECAPATHHRPHHLPRLKQSSLSIPCVSAPAITWPDIHPHRSDRSKNVGQEFRIAPDTPQTHNPPCSPGVSMPCLPSSRCARYSPAANEALVVLPMYSVPTGM